MDLQDSLLHELRLKYRPLLPAILNHAEGLVPQESFSAKPLSPEIAKFFPHSSGKTSLSFKIGPSASRTPQRVGVLFSGGQAPGGHNVVTGLFDYLAHLHPESKLFGFLGGPSGLIKGSSIEITEPHISQFRNQGGFDLLGSGRTKLETPDQFLAAENSVKKLNLDGLVIIGGDDSNTNGALLAEYFLSRGIKTCVIGVPKTIDGDLKNSEIEISFGFDSACKVFSDLIGNIQRDAISAKKYYHFIKLMGRTASHITLECALRTHPNAALIGEEIAEKKKSLAAIVRELSDMICERAVLGKNFGVILIPEGILEFIPECKRLIAELNSLLAAGHPVAKSIEMISDVDAKLSRIEGHLSAEANSCLRILPKEIKHQLLQDRDPHGNVQVSQIDSERLILTLVKTELEKRRAAGTYKGSFKGLPHFYGYEGRACYPSNFDAQYCYALGQTAGILVKIKATGYLACVKKLASPINDWEVGGVPLASMMTIEKRDGKDKPVIAKALVDLSGSPFKLFEKNRNLWALDDEYDYPGPQQYFGPAELTEAKTLTLQLELDQLTPS